ncbi:hypothetical protein [Microbulbifer thermotolerans]|uniref:hypothetical protein n=1 Tax=Microbulbifer thermotolerans TaxID=252514 RepID=UPI00224AA1E0|nr:hypothetical protein [Microbulbifer thermotolerans]MCX2780425.1 hypothetical protein [Microbulbifer thermotolerans]MCX2805903.1 hypothetical protein [Microbulbifer thermotolerans]
MALRLSGGVAPRWYTPKDVDEHDSNPPAFLLQPLTQVQTMEILSDGSFTDEGNFVPSHAGRMKMLAWGIKGWRNIEDENGIPADFEPGKQRDLPWNLQLELATEILTSSMLGEDERKNSQSQSSSPESPGNSIATTANGAGIATQTTPHHTQNG